MSNPECSSKGKVEELASASSKSKNRHHLYFRQMKRRQTMTMN